MSASASIENHNLAQGSIANATDFLTVMIQDQTFGIPVTQVQDVLNSQSVTKIPLSPPEIAGSLNLRGRIVTAIDVRKKLGLEQGDVQSKNMSVVVEYKNELYSLVIDRVGDVLTLKDEAFENTPSTLDPMWRDVAAGIFRLENKLLVVIDVAKFIESIHADKAS